MTQGRFTLKVAKDSSDVWGWNGWLFDRQTKVNHPLIRTYVDYELDGEVGYAQCAFDTKEEMRKAAIRKARKIERRAA
jgi:hypothetical protein